MAGKKEGQTNKPQPTKPTRPLTEGDRFNKGDSVSQNRPRPRPGPSDTGGGSKGR